MRKILFIFILLVSCNPQLSNKNETLKGKVVSVADGDTITILTDGNTRVRIRLYGIDAPERGQDYGTKARQYLNDLCYGKNVRVETKGVDRYNRVLGVVYVADLNLNKEMVRQGLAWYYSYYVEDSELEALEQSARRQNLNIWSMKNPVPPYEHRKSKKQKRTDKD
jgi:endonuclease YncB( thermonuclease family)